MKLLVPIGTPHRTELSTQELWLSDDNGLVACWERGRQVAQEQPDLAASANAGELVPLPWKGGVAQAIKAKRKYGTLRYLAMWQGVRGEDLNIDTAIEREITCSKFGVTVQFTPDASKYENE